MEAPGTDPGGIGPYDAFAREAASDRRRLRVAVAAALACHLLLLLLPLPHWDDHPPVRGLAVDVQPFRLRNVRFASPAPPPVPLLEEEGQDPQPPEPVAQVATEELRPEPPLPPVVSARVLLPGGSSGSLVPPQPLTTPPPAYPEAVWRQGIHGEVLLTVVVDGEGQVLEVTVEEGPEPLGALSAEAVRSWLFLPASLAGNPITTALRVRILFPDPEAGPSEAEAVLPLQR